jgi:hypothetical protein
LQRCGYGNEQPKRVPRLAKPHARPVAKDILTLSNRICLHAASFLTAQAALKRLDLEGEAVSDSLGAAVTRLLRTVTLSACLPAVIEICYDRFARSMITLAAAGLPGRLGIPWGEGRRDDAHGATTRKRNNRCRVKSCRTSRP